MARTTSRGGRAERAAHRRTGGRSAEARLRPRPRARTRHPRSRVRRNSFAVRAALRRVRSCAEIPAGDDGRLPVSRVPAQWLRRDANDDHDDTRRDGRRRHPRSPRWGVRSLFDRRFLAGAALREDAVRQRPAHTRVSARIPRDGRNPLPARRPRHRPLRATRHARSPPRLVLRGGRRLRRRRRKVLLLVDRRDPRGLRRRRRRRDRVLRRHRGRELHRSPYRLPGQHPAREGT